MICLILQVQDTFSMCQKSFLNYVSGQILSYNNTTESVSCFAFALCHCSWEGIVAGNMDGDRVVEGVRTLSPKITLCI